MHRHAPILRVLALCALLAGHARPAAAHGADIAVGGGARGPVSLNAAQQRAIGLRTATAGLHPLEQYLNLAGEVQAAPERQADVATRISGQVTAVYVRVGDAVAAGRPLARVQARLVGDPPPSVDVVAPIGGVVDAVDAVRGQPVEPSTVLMHVSDRSVVDVVARVPEPDLARVHRGQAVRVHVTGYPDRVFTGRVDAFAPLLDPQTRTRAIRVRVANPGGLLIPNLYARASVVLRAGDPTLTVPRAAVLQADGESFVFVRRGERFDRVDIKPGAGDDASVEVLDGLVPGDVLVTQGVREVYTLWLTGGRKPAAAEGDD